MSRHIFINYRRADSEGYAGRIFDSLSSRFGERNIFMDVTAIDAGVDFSREIQQAIEGCDVLLALIGPQWLTVKDKEGKVRLEDPGDYVRLEIGTALGRGIRVIPVLVQGASMPKTADLPEELKPLRKRNAIELSSSRFHTDVDRLIEAIERAMDEAEREKSPPGAMRSLHQLPEPPADFTGREELITQLIADFKKGKGATITGQPIRGLIGMGGIGKTALGLVVAHKLAKDYPDAQIFLDLKGTTTPLSATEIIRHVILSFEPTMDLRELDEAGMINTYRSVLHGKRVLLFLDNVRSAEQIAPLRPPGTCALLVTSRWTFSVPGLHPRRVDLMSEENAKAFLLELCPRIGDKAADLAKACARLPLALRIAGSFLAVNTDWRVEEYVKQLKDHKQRLATFKQSREEAELNTEPDLLATFELSYSGLSDEHQKRWRMLGVFPGSFDASAATAMWKWEVDETRKLLGLLLRYSLLDYDEPSSRYSLHDLLMDYALMQMEPEETVAARISHSVYYSEVLGNINQMYLRGGENIVPCLRLYDADWMNIEAGQQNSVLFLQESSEAARACNWYAWQGSINGLRLKPKDQIKWVEAGLRAARVLEDRKAEAAHLGNLGLAYADLGEARKAIEFYEQALVIVREIGDRRGEGAALGNLGNAYADLGEVRKAIEFYEGHLAIAREIGDRLGKGNALGNLGVAYYGLGKVRKAIEFHEQALVIDREIGDRRGEGADLGNLGNAYADLGEVRKAIEFYEGQLVIVQEIGDRHGEGTALGSLGTAYADLGEVRKAIEFYEGQLVIVREIGDRHGEGNALGNLGNAYKNLGEVRKAIEFYEQALAIARKIGDRRGEGNASFNMGLALYELEEKDRAIHLVRRALEIYEAIESPAAEKARKKLKEWGAPP